MENTEKATAFQQTIIDVTNTTNVKVRFAVVALDTANYITNLGDTDKNETYAQFIKLGAT